MILSINKQKEIEVIGLQLSNKNAHGLEKKRSYRSCRTYIEMMLMCEIDH